MSHADLRKRRAPHAAWNATVEAAGDVMGDVTGDVWRARAGDPTAFMRLLDAARPSVRAIVMRVVRDADLGRDVEQDVYTAAWRDLTRLRAAEHFLHWIRRIARNQSIHALRTRLRERARSVGPDDALAAQADASPSPLDRLVASETYAALRAAVASLPPTSREVILLHYRDGRPLHQVAERLGIGYDAVRQRLVRARAVLRRALSVRS